MRLWIAAALAALSLPSIVEAKKAPPPSAAIEGQTVHKPIAEGGLPYLLFIPKGYNQSGSERWPLVIFLHGSGEPGTDIEVVKKHGPPMLVEKNAAFPFIVISPQLPEQTGPADRFWPIPPLDALLDHALKTWRIDPSRVYLTGLSLGAALRPGTGARRILNASRHWRPSRRSAILRMPAKPRTCRYGLFTATTTTPSTRAAISRWSTPSKDAARTPLPA